MRSSVPAILGPGPVSCRRFYSIHCWKGRSKCTVPTSPADFSEPVAGAVSESLTRQADALASTLSCQSYGAVLEGFGQVGKWLAVNEVIAAADPDCNCGSHDQCADGWHCASVNCTSKVGTRNWGRCKKGPAPTEAEPEVLGATSRLDF